MRSHQNFIIQRTDDVRVKDRQGSTPGVTLFFGIDLMISMPENKEEELLEMLEDRRLRRKLQRARSFNSKRIAMD